MKSRLYLLCGILFSAFMFSQSSSGEKMNIVKTNVTAYAFRNINLTYERAFNKWFSISAGFGTMPMGGVPFLNTIVKDADKEFTDMQVSNTNFTIETRFYLGSGYGHGFYFAPYYRNTSFKAHNLIYHFQDSNNLDQTATISGKANGNSVGLLMGTQLFLGKKDNWVLDLWIIGGHYGSGKGDFTGKSSKPLTQADQDELKQSIQDVQIPFVKYTVTTDSNGAYVKIDGPWAGIRSGISLGYRF